MNWREVKQMLRGKLEVKNPIKGKKHDSWPVECDGRYIGKVTVGHHDGELKPWELGNCAGGIGLNEKEFKLLVGCTMSREEFCEKHK